MNSNFKILEQAIFNTSIEYPNWEIQDIEQKLNEKNLNTTELIKDYFERVNQYKIFEKDLLKRLTEEGIIKLSKHKYYSLSNSNTKGCTGEQMAFKYIFNNYIVDTFEYNALPEYKKKGWKIIDDNQLINFFIKEVAKQIFEIEEEFKNKYNISFDEI
jgi:hypothetical protein